MGAQSDLNADIRLVHSFILVLEMQDCEQEIHDSFTTNYCQTSISDLHALRLILDGTKRFPSYEIAVFNCVRVYKRVPIERSLSLGLDIATFAPYSGQLMAIIRSYSGPSVPCNCHQEVVI